MPKLSNLGNSGFGRVPADWHDNASQDTLFQNWPEVPGTDDTYLEPYGNPAYEGYGYPAAGYGQTRRKVVGLAIPKQPSPQLSSNGWAGKVPVGTIVRPMGTLNSKSDEFTRAQVAVLQGLSATDDVPSQEVQNKRRAAAWKIVSEMDRLYEVAKAAKPGAFTTAVRSWAGLDAPVVALNRLVRDYYPIMRPSLIGQEGVFEKLDAAVKRPERNWKAWMEAAQSLAGEFNGALGDVQTFTLMNMITQASSETLSQIGGGLVEGGNRALTILDWLTKPYVLIPVGLGLAAVYLYARGGGTVVRYQMPAPKEQMP